jgi:SAM-dependent methyltransferase
VRRQATKGRLRAEQVFETWYGRLYDAGIQTRSLAIPGGLLLWGADVPRIYQMMADGIACDPGQVVLDLPTGGGVTFAAGAPETDGLLVGIDLSRLMLGRAAARRRRAGLERKVALVRADARRLPLLDASVDRVLSFNSLHCMPDEVHLPVLREVRRVLKPGGALVGTTLVADASIPFRFNIELARLGRFFFPPDSRLLAARARRAGFRLWTQDRVGAALYFHGE